MYINRLECVTNVTMTVCIIYFRLLLNEKKCTRKHLEEETGVTYVDLEVPVAPQTEDCTKYIYTINYVKSES